MIGLINGIKKSQRQYNLSDDVMDNPYTTITAEVRNFTFNANTIRIRLKISFSEDVAIGSSNICQIRIE